MTNGINWVTNQGENLSTCSIKSLPEIIPTVLSTMRGNKDFNYMLKHEKDTFLKQSSKVKH